MNHHSGQVTNFVMPNQVLFVCSFFFFNPQWMKIDMGEGGQKESITYLYMVEV